ncbi:hypothetical protein I6A84_13045 [Frankia sp. CNm7]|uniref:Uncharacterized protein n=1 Tax=Frankia nepalensis TaxID=1836974 RepID=A0A937R9Q9_9ACTN|nr:hypothetical protein [Frankia nepalensis]MBL7499649.1 hypothetical protein [Frankia nepalensis]MBL7514451.1 hypothetical protein [Frankia nepalensis]MBL7519006.1 hypothetical protein [Frankia nepalensis]MBL7628026.1 hypothetical protein [Frankia nepalensis]
MARTLDDLRTLAERVQKAERDLTAARRERDDAIREVRAAGGHTVPAIADAAGVSLATAKIVLRGTS